MPNTAQAHAEIVWAGDLKWREGQKRDLEPRIQHAYATAVDGLSEACFSTSGSKAIHLRKVPVGRHHLAEANSVDQLTMLLDNVGIANSRHRFGFFKNVSIISHELTHQERMRHLPYDNSLGERLVTEGLANVAESLVRQLVDPAAITRLDEALLTGSNYWQWKLCEFLTDLQDVAEDNSPEVALQIKRSVHSKWFSGSLEGYGLGSWVVYLNYVEDEDFDRILRLPTEKMLDVL